LRRLGEIASSSSPSNLRHVPSGSLQAEPATLDDFSFSATPLPPWYPIVAPFLGRLQNTDDDGLTTNAKTLLRVDPLLVLHRQRQDNDPLSIPSLNLASRTNANDASLSLGRFDAPVRQAFARLDPATLWEQWFRIMSPLPGGVVRGRMGSVPSIVASAPNDAVAGLSQSRSLERLFDPARVALPPQVTTHVASEPDALEWREGGLAVADFLISNSSSATHSFYGPGAQLLLALPQPTGRDSRSRSISVTVLPPPMGKPLTPEWLHPVSFAVCPYRSIRLLNPPDGLTEPDAIFTDVLVREPNGTSLMVLRGRLWQKGEDPRRPGVSRQITDDLIVAWAKDLWSRLAADSTIGVLRVREDFVNRDPDASPDIGTVRVAYRFVLLTRASTTRQTELSPLPIRGELGQLRFAETAFYDTDPPTHPSALALNPPRVRAVTPRFNLDDSPFGMSALTLDIDLTRERVGLSGELLVSAAWNAWWQTVSLALQYAAPSTSSQRILPLNFRSRAIRSLAATLPDLPTPEDSTLPLFEGDGTVAPALRSWQPVLPGSLRWTGIGNRAGAFFAARPQLITQFGAEKALTSGSIPVQHRFPRPTPIPKNVLHGQEKALVPWGEWFDLNELATVDRSVAASYLPADDAFITTIAGPAGLRVEFAGPFDTDRGAVPLELWRTGEKVGLPPLNFRLNYTRLGQPIAWDPLVSLNCGTFRVAFETSGAADGVRTYKPSAMTKEQAESFAEWIGGRSHGDEFLLELSVGVPDGTFVVKDLKVALRLASRFTSASALPQPVRPITIRFEDPEYSRKLQSRAQHKTFVITRTAPNGDVNTGTVTVAIDRERINPTSTLNLAFRFGGFAPVGGETAAELNDYLNSLDARVQVFRVREGIRTPENDEFDPVLGQSAPFRCNHLATIQFPITFQRGSVRSPQLIEPHDKIQIGFELVNVDGSPRLNETAFDVFVVEESITPAVQRAYGLLLRSASGAVECRRFAWSPTPARTELINPDDLFQPIVRRRGIFRWSDTLRLGVAPAFAVQAITPSGATHIPDDFAPPGQLPMS
jgi:hypothetical protein